MIRNVEKWKIVQDRPKELEVEKKQGKRRKQIMQTEMQNEYNTPTMTVIQILTLRRQRNPVDRMMTTTDPESIEWTKERYQTLEKKAVPSIKVTQNMGRSQLHSSRGKAQEGERRRRDLVLLLMRSRQSS